MAGGVLIPNPHLATATRPNVKNKNRSSITDDHLEQRMLLATTSLEADKFFRFFSSAKTKVKWLSKLIAINAFEINLQLIGV